MQASPRSLRPFPRSEMSETSYVPRGRFYPLYPVYRRRVWPLGDYTMHASVFGSNKQIRRTRNGRATNHGVQHSFLVLTSRYGERLTRNVGTITETWGPTPQSVGQDNGETRERRDLPRKKQKREDRLWDREPRSRQERTKSP
jgi:hypothetical protein